VVFLLDVGKRGAISGPLSAWGCSSPRKRITRAGCTARKSTSS